MTRALILSTFLLLFAVPASAQTQPVITPEWHERIVHGMIGAGMAAHGADLASTFYGLGKGTLTEGNPALKWATDRGPVTGGIVKMSFAVGSSYALIRLHRTHPKWALALAIGQTVGISYVAYRNTRLLR